MKNKIKNIVMLSFLSASVLSCVNDSFDNPLLTAECVSPSLTKTKEVQDIYNATPFGGTPQYTADDVIEAIVTSSDEGGNFFKTISLMSTDGTRGFSVSIDEYNLYTKNLQPGKKVFVKLKDLYTSRPTGGAGGLNFGGAPSGSFNTLARIPVLEYEKFIIPTCTTVDEETIVKRLTLAQLNNDAYLNALVEVDNVQFESEGTTYGNKPTDPSDKNENISDGITSFVTRTSKFSNFAGSILPLGRGKIRGVLTKFNSTYQLIIRNERDVKLTGTRLDFAPPIVGNATVFSGTLNEPFTSYLTTNQTNFPKYINDAYVSSRYWQLKTFSGNKYIEMSSFNGGSNPGVPAKTYFFIPVDFTAANAITFKEEIRFYKGGAPLQVYYVKSSDYVPGSVINLANFTNITAGFTGITYPAIDGTENAFNSAGTYAIPPSLTGNGYFVFEYTGTTTLTTTVQIDDIIVN
jgi:Family of unknown function (DUF5689)